LDLVRKYIGAVKRNPRGHTAVTIALSLTVTLRVMWMLLQFVNLSVLGVIAFFLCPFLSMSLFWAAAASPVKSPLWLYRVLGIGAFVLTGYKLSVEFIRTEPRVGTHRLWLWALIWIIPLVGCLVLLLLHKGLTLLDRKNKKPGRLYRMGLMTMQPFFTCKTTEVKKLSRGEKIFLVVGCFVMALSSLMMFATVYLRFHFPSMDAEAIIFTVQYANDGYSPQLARLLMVYIVLIILFAVLLSLRLIRMYRAETVTFTCPDRSSSFSRNARSVRRTAWVLIPVMSLTALFAETHTYAYIWHQIRKTQIYDQYYVVPDDQTVTFPDKKKNLIYIFLESFENSYTTPENGGLQHWDFMPELTQLAKENVNFSHNELLGGSVGRAPSVAYTMGATVAQTSGVMLMTPLGKMRNKMDELNSFLPSLRRLEDVLHDNGYEQLFIQGSDASFAAYSSYVGRYDNSNIFDYEAAKKQGYIPEDYMEMWGFEDMKLFEFSKKKIDELAEKGKPFAVTMYTMDTHSYEEGYRCPLCDSSIGSNFAAAVRCSSKQVGEFINWLKTRPYYEDTVVVLTGDHIAEHMINGIDFEEEGYTRTPFNCFIGAVKQPKKAKNRLFSPLDMFPTTLSAMGAEIKGDRLGLGTDLFSDTPTLCEQLGTEEFMDQLQRRSDYFNHEFWK